MNDMIAWIAAEAERPEDVEVPRRGRSVEDVKGVVREVRSHQFPSRGVTGESRAQYPPFAKNAKDGAPSVLPLPEPSVSHPTPSAVSVPKASEFPTTTFPASPLPAEDAGNGAPTESLVPVESAEEVEDRVRRDEKERRIYRGRTVAMLRRYMRYSIETGRLPSLLGGEIFRAKVTTYTVVTFEDRVIFVHDMETCLARLDEFSRQLIARHILQEHDQAATGRLLQCTERTVRTYIPVVLDVLSQILIEVGLLERLDSDTKKSCQGGKRDPIRASDCEDGKYKV